MYYRFGAYSLDTQCYELAEAGVPIPLRPKVFQVLLYLLAHHERVVRKEELLEHVWPGQFVGDVGLNNCVMEVRKALGDRRPPYQVLRTVRGHGYRVVVPVEARDEAPLASTRPCLLEPPPSLAPPPMPDLPTQDALPRWQDPAPRGGTAPVAMGGASSAPRSSLAPMPPLDRPALDLSRGGLASPVPPFTGYQDQLDRCLHALAETVRGHPQVLLLTGDAGMGKTRLLTEVRALASQHGLQVCAGRCYEHATLPYLPFAQGLFPALTHAQETLQTQLGADAALLRRLLDPDGAFSPAASATTFAQAERDTLRLVLAVERATRTLADHQPLVLVMDDMHWADGPSLDLFAHLVLSVADTVGQPPVPLCLVGTYRPVVPGERLARMLLRLQREALCQTLDLAGLEEAEVTALLQGLGVRRPSHHLVATVHTLTQGNPLFIQEVVHQLRQQGALQERGGGTVTTASLADLRLPAHVTGAVAARTHGVSASCRRLLTLAAFLGEECPVSLLSAVSGLDEAAVLDGLEEGMHQGLLRSEGPGFQFAHPLLRHVLYSTPSVARRQRLHAQIAHILAQRSAGQSEEPILAIAHHLVRAGALAEQGTAVRYACKAGDQALTRCAWREAAQYYAAALSVSAATAGLSAPARAALHFRAGLAYHRDQDVGPCLEHYAQAIAAYRALKDVRGLAQVLLEQTETQFTLASVPLGTLPDLEPLEEMLEELQDAAPELCGRIFALLAQAYRHARQGAKAHTFAQRALLMGQDLADDDLCARAGAALGLGYMQSLQVHEALDSWQHAVEAARRLHDLRLHGCPLARIPLGLVLLGRLEEAETVADKATVLNRTIHEWGEGVSVALSHLVCVAVARGDFATAERRTQETMAAVSRSGYPWGGFRALLALACAQTLRGAWPDAAATLALLREPGQVFHDPGAVVHIFTAVLQQLVHAYAAGEHARLDVQAADVMQRVSPDSYSLAPLCALVELADLMATPLLAEQPSQALVRAVERGICFSSGWMFLIPRVVGVAATLARRWDTAEAHFQTAIDTATRVGARPELGRTYMDYGRMLMARGMPGDGEHALAYMTRAGSLFHTLGMTPFMQRVQQQRELLQGPAEADGAPCAS